jgi:hypothetical protein
MGRELRAASTDQLRSRIERVAGKIGVNDAVAGIRHKIFAEIARAYPELRDECTRRAEMRRVSGLWTNRAAQFEEFRQATAKGEVVSSLCQKTELSQESYWALSSFPIQSSSNPSGDVSVSASFLEKQR